jgi:hypothetical protein
VGPLSFIQIVVDRNVVMRRIPVYCARHKLLPHDDGLYIVPGTNYCPMTTDYTLYQEEIPCHRVWRYNTLRDRYYSGLLSGFPLYYKQIISCISKRRLVPEQTVPWHTRWKVCWLWPAVSSQLLHRVLSVYTRLDASCRVTSAKYFYHRATVIGYIGLFQISKDICSFSVTVISA